MSAIDEVWLRLGEVVALQFRSESRSGIGWSGVGSGLVKVVSNAPDRFVFEESGHWQQQGGGKIRFTNSFRWSRLENGLRLEHLRFGEAHPVFLFDMAPHPDGVWRSLEPHACREDFYSAALEFDASRLRISWEVQGAKRNESIGYCYF